MKESIQWNTGLGEIFLGTRDEFGQIKRMDGTPCRPQSEITPADTNLLNEFIKTGKWIFAAK